MASILFFFDSVVYGATALLFVVAGALVSIRFLNFPDLTIDGSFTISACTYARLTHSGIDPLLAVVFGCISGAAAGALTAILNEKGKIGQILASVFVMLALISIAPYILGRATIGLLQEQTLLSQLESTDALFTTYLFPGARFTLHFLTNSVLLSIAAVFLFLIYRFTNTGFGIMIRYHGSAKAPRGLLRDSVFRVKLAGLVLGNLLVGLGAVIEAQRRGGADQAMGIGIILLALASLILGETVVRVATRRRILNVKQEIAAVIVGTFLYSAVIQITLLLGISIIDIRLLSIIILAALLLIASSRYPRNLDMF